MSRAQLDTLLARLSQTSPVWWVIWCGLMFMTIALLALMRTRWGQSQPLRKCVALSILAHLLMASYATTVQIVHTTIGPARSGPIQISAVSTAQSGSVSSPHGTPTQRAESFANVPVQAIDAPTAERAATAAQLAATAPAPEAAVLPVAPPQAADTATNKIVEPGSQLAETEITPRDHSNSAEAATPLVDAPTAERADRPSAAEPSAAGLERPQPVAAESAPTEEGSPVPLEALAGSIPVAADSSANPDPAAILADVNDRLDRPGSPLEPAQGNDVNLATPTPANAASSGALAGGGLIPEVGALAGSVAGGSSTPLVDAPLLPPVRTQQSSSEIPEIFRGRLEQAGGQHDSSSGATADTEHAVQSALRWLAANQSPDGRWDAQKFGAGTERREIGPKGVPQDRQQAGTKADTGVSGLALLAFLGAGNTHLSGDYRETVRKGLDYLLASQSSNGNLGGQATTYAFMYCHGMATFALSEAYAMTGDRRLAEPVRRAIGFSLASQHPATGGWRYRPGELGDMSQLGWQLMALKSASLAGIDVPKVALDRASKFIRSVSFGTHGGLASYRPGEEGSRTMTAEALASRQFLGLVGETPAAREAANYILSELPGAAQPNLYYWYYASLAMHNLQGESWETWNAALQRELLSSQETTGPMTGTWPTDSLWAGYGGRVYTTAMGALCLEVYYRYLPIYLEATARGAKVR